MRATALKCVKEAYNVRCHRQNIKHMTEDTDGHYKQIMGKDIST